MSLFADDRQGQSRAPEGDQGGGSLGGDGTTILARDEEYLLPVYARYPVVMERGEGCRLWDVDGNEYLDVMGGLGVNALGHAHPRMVAAMVDQASKMVHLSPQFSNRWASLLAEKLCKLSGMSGVFFSTGGSEAVEGALKLARTHGRQHGGVKKHGLVALRKSYHGRTFGSMSVTGQDKYSIDFGPGLPGVHFIDRNDVAQLRAAVNEDTCAILLEPVLGEGRGALSLGCLPAGGTPACRSVRRPADPR